MDSHSLDFIRLEYSEGRRIYLYEMEIESYMLQGEEAPSCEYGKFGTGSCELG